jgi:hypothetical protein
MSAKNSRNRFLPTFDVLEARCAPSALGLGRLSREPGGVDHGAATRNGGDHKAVRRLQIEVERLREREREHPGLRARLSGELAQLENELDARMGAL